MFPMGKYDEALALAAINELNKKMVTGITQAWDAAADLAGGDKNEQCEMIGDVLWRSFRATYAGVIVNTILEQAKNEGLPVPRVGLGPDDWVAHW